VKRRSAFAWWIAGVAAIALAVRLTYVFTSRRDWYPAGDAYFYHQTANYLAAGKWFISPFAPHAHVQAAEHPPLYSMFLAIPSLLGLHSTLTHVLWSCAVGVGTVVLVGLIGREVRGERAGVIAAFIAAIYPNMWGPDGTLEAETLGMFMVALAVLLAYRYWKQPSRARIVWLGVVCALAALTRSELVLLLPLLVLPLVLLQRERPVKERWKALGIATVAMVLVIAPWTIYNETRFEHTVVLSTQLGPMLSSANCDSTYYGNAWGYFDIACTMAVDEAHGLKPGTDESVVDKIDRKAAIDYIKGHLSRLPQVENVRLTRMAGLVRPTIYVSMDIVLDGRERWLAWWALYSFYAVAVLAIFGALDFRRHSSGVPLFPLLAPIGVVIVTTLTAYASTRFRSTAEPVLCVLAALAIDGLIRWVWARRRARRGEPVVPVNAREERPPLPV
jgi:4-amino-4-deoxy-L-arabinose transferase-like glycosyltransferase